MTNRDSRVGSHHHHHGWVYDSDLYVYTSLYGFEIAVAVHPDRPTRLSGPEVRLSAYSTYVSNYPRASLPRIDGYWRRWYIHRAEMLASMWPQHVSGPPSSGYHRYGARWKTYIGILLPAMGLTEGDDDAKLMPLTQILGLQSPVPQCAFSHLPHSVSDSLEVVWRTRMSKRHQQIGQPPPLDVRYTCLLLIHTYPSTSAHHHRAVHCS
ncbi:hypothetical protein BZA05DRAFT_395902 [Tricharina praecox]|uniref:uncharacterized protein n=1 Tax=Tricharina praecox TaxID=43433 RepID=UPI00222025FE|nr:uncharacterized protein BZA05DRAFT_395902 [Tricharina praecox]KAI5853393.1 hypothetical protein BZA05DRAFT_395902 [Tricharina praecox]